MTNSISTGRMAITEAAIMTWYSFEDSATRYFIPMGSVLYVSLLVMISGQV